jgi:hypothetical protein
MNHGQKVVELASAWKHCNKLPDKVPLKCETIEMPDACCETARRPRCKMVHVKKFEGPEMLDLSGVKNLYSTVSYEPVG